ncbi:response regulator transcription factor [Meridianimarinicoccus sp. RP-17]|uniref:response regulator transcription factor n=1 Tax=Meridianimarinicoccus zhengii TaxID=2056810 RepID=UPI000DAD1806|nr:response regulator transcription factor [Phycocomes zhengii]
MTAIKFETRRDNLADRVTCTRPRILIVDDEPDILELLDIGLSGAGFEVHGASTATEFLSKYAQIEPDLCVVDVTLPDVSGFALVEKLRQGGDIGIVVLTGRGSDTDHVRGRDLGADDYITKPFRIRDVAARLHAVLQHRALQAQDAADRAIGFAGADAPVSAALRRAKST